MEFPSNILNDLHSKFLRENLMKARVSNTGKTITVTLDKDNDLPAAFLSYADGTITLTPTSEGHAFSSHSMTRRSKDYPDWPLHGKLELEFHNYAAEGSNFFFKAKLPSILPEPRPLRSKHPEPIEIAAAGNVTIHLAGADHNCQVPEGELLPLVLEWAKKGYLL